MRDELAARPDYEAMYNRLAGEHKKLCADFAELQALHKQVLAEHEKVNAQLDIVHLIFGNR